MTTRREQAESWAATQLGWDDWQSTSVSSDASFRSYFRLEHAGKTAVVMDAPPDREPVDAFIDIAGRLMGLAHVPDILGEDRQRGFLLLEDLGSQPFHHVLDETNADELFSDALSALIRIQRDADTSGLPSYDAATLMRELALFPDWFLAHHWHVEPSDDELDAWDHVCATLLRWALDQPQVLCHRDFMPRNLLVAEPNPGVIDFQDALIGPISYDPVCLFRDAFLSWPDERVRGWLEQYRQQALRASLPVPESAAFWQRSCDLMGVQRHLKVIGVFARIRYRDAKPKYLEDAPRFFGYINRAIARCPELDELGRLLAAWEARAKHWSA